MKTLSFFVCFLLCCVFSFAQRWTQQQLDNANTAVNSSYLSAVEIDAIRYINLARLYPKNFVQNELNNDQNNTQAKQDLIGDLNNRAAAQALQPDDNMYSFAKCFAEESGNNGSVGHNRINCTSPSGAWAECCSYGMQTGRDIALQWLIDDGVAGAGHRVNCLNPSYSKIGLSFHTHTAYQFCAVADLAP